LQINLSQLVALQGKQALFIELSKERDLELYLKIDPQQRTWKVFVSTAAQNKPAETSTATPSSSAVITTVPVAVTARASAAPASPISGDREWSKSPPPTPPHVEIPPLEVVDLAANITEFPLESDLAPTFEHFRANLLPRFQASFPAILVEDLDRLISLRWRTLPLVERLVYRDAMLLTTPTPIPGRIPAGATTNGVH